MSRNAFGQCEREYNERIEQREHAAMERAAKPEEKVMRTPSELLKTFKEATQRQYDMWQGPTGSGVVSFHTQDVVAALESHAELLVALDLAKHMLERDHIDPAKYAVIEKCEAAIAKARGEA